MGRDHDLGDSFERFIADQLAAGHYDNRAGVIRAGLTSLEGQEAACDWSDDALRRAIEKADADIAAGRVTTVRSAADAEALGNDIKKRGRDRLAKAPTS